MAFVYLLSWPYDDVTGAMIKAHTSYARITNGLDRGAPYPYEGGCEVGLITAGPNNMVGIFGKGSPPATLVHDMETWLGSGKGIEKPTAAETYEVGEGSLADAVAAHGWGEIFRVYDWHPGKTAAAG